MPLDRRSCPPSFEVTIRSFCSAKVGVVDWKPFILTCLSRTADKITFRQPVLRPDLDAIEAEFNLQLPSQYRELLLQTNGVFDEYDCPIIDDIEGVRWMNRNVRELDCYMPLDHIFFISSVYGNGDYVGYGLRRDAWEYPALFRWDHEDDSRKWEAPDLKTWFEWFQRDDACA